MATSANHTKQFLSLFNETARYHHRRRVFRDFITLAAVSIHNGINFDETLEQEYMETIRHYDAADATRMADLLAHVVMGVRLEKGKYPTLNLFFRLSEPKNPSSAQGISAVDDFLNPFNIHES